MAHHPAPAAYPLRAVLHPTDFSAASDLAFAHALRIALAARAQFDILHVEPADPRDVDWTGFPGVRATLAEWGLLAADSPPEAVAERLGVRIRKVDLVDRDPVRGIVRFAEEHPVDLIVLATHGREGLPRWLHGSVAEPVVRRTHAPTLLLPHGARGFVEPETGRVRLSRMLVPIDHEPRPGRAVERAWRLARTLGAAAEGLRLTLLHVGDAAAAPRVHPPAEATGHVETLARHGDDVVGAIVDAAAELDADLVVMATRGHRGLLDTLRGSTTEQVLRRVSRPVLAVPVG
ncbi:MAG TPA: universal stress protein [Geminicoccaceae bacterium]|nr:universal stress protein [Geminicoccaceae bacterium]